MKICKECGGNLLYLFEFNNVALFGCNVCRIVRFYPLNEGITIKNKKFDISNLVKNAVREYMKKKEKEKLEPKLGIDISRKPWG